MNAVGLELILLEHEIRERFVVHDPG